MESHPAEGVVNHGSGLENVPWRKPPIARSYRGRAQKAPAGASLIELLFVAAVMMLMGGLLYSALSSFSSSAGRRGAVDVLLNTLEHARIAALESGQTVYVGFADSDFPIPEMRYASFLVFRETSDEERRGGAGNYTVLTKWTKLPKNVAFKRVAGSLIPNSGGQIFPGLEALLPATQRDETFPAVAFNSSGAVVGGSNPLQLFLYQGYYADQQDIRTVKGGDLFDKISLSRYTGRAQADLTTTNVQ
jgi:hypothetical protein